MSGYLASMKDYAWFHENAWDMGEKYAHRVGQKLPNQWGLYDMMGNVWEWTADRYGDYPSGEVTDPTGADGGSDRLFRGGSFSDGSFNDVSSYCRPANRYRYSAGFQSYNLGFRVALVQGSSQ